jgi:hypothetical protein
VTVDTVVEIQSAAGDVILTSEDRGYDEDVTSEPLAAGTYYVKVSQSGRYDSVKTAYRLAVTLE